MLGADIRCDEVSYPGGFHLDQRFEGECRVWAVQITDRQIASLIGFHLSQIAHQPTPAGHVDRFGQQLDDLVEMSCRGYE